MNYYTARQRTDGRWDFTCNGHPWGYCRLYEEFKKGSVFSDGEVERYNLRYGKFKEKYHTDGHATKEEAGECYKQYLLDHKYRGGEDSGTQRKCEVCKAWTSRFIEVDCHIWMLCDEHQNRAEVEKLMEAPDTIWSSW